MTMDHDTSPDESESLQPTDRRLLRCLLEAAEAILEGRYVGPDQLVCYILPALTDDLTQHPEKLADALALVRAETAEVGDAEGDPQFDSDTDYAAYLLDDYAGMCRIIRDAVRQGKPFKLALPKFRGAWLGLQVLLEGLAQEAHYDDGREGFRVLSRQVLQELQTLRREMLVPNG